MNQVNHKRHAKYLERFLHILPGRLSSHDSTRVMIAFFAVSGLDILDAMDLLSTDTRNTIIDWIYSQQFTSNHQRAGITGTTMLNGIDTQPTSGLHDYIFGHLAMTYTGIAVLLALDDDLSRLDRQAIVAGVAAVQQADGSFSPTLQGCEYDMRFVYCAACICHFLDDWTGVDVDKMVSYIESSIRYDFGISQHEQMESHGGTTFCALAALQLSGRFDVLSATTVEGIKRWLLFRQEEGFQGRPNKPMDTCYSFWIGAALKILDAFELSDSKQNRDYILSTQNTSLGGFSKWPGVSTDPFHTYFGLCGLSFLKQDNILPLMPALNISVRAYRHMESLHIKWRGE